MRTTSRFSLMVAVACTVAACAEEATVLPLPAELMGRWETTAAEYADRFFELSDNAIIIGTGGATRQRYMISEVSRVTDVDGLLYTVTYRDAAGEVYSMDFYFSSSGRDMIRFKNQRNMVWRKVRL